MSAPSAPVNATTTEPLFFSRNMGNMIHIAFETIILSVMSYYFYRKTSTLSNEMKVMEAKISQLELTVKEQKTFINEKIAEMVSLVSTQISRSSFTPPPPPRQNFQYQQPVQQPQYQQQVQPVQQPQYQQQVQPVQQQVQPVQQQPQYQQQVQPVQQQVQPVQQQVQPVQQQLQPVQQQVQPVQQQVQPVQQQLQPVQQQVQHRYADNNMAEMSIVVMEVISSNPTPKNEKYSQISVIDDDDDDDYDDDETIDMDKELKEELSELSS